VRHLVSNVLLWIGVGLNVIACLGVLVMRDALDRLHFSSPPVLGGVFIAAGVVVKDSFSLVGDKAILIAVFLIVASPIVTHAIGRAARIDATGDWRVTGSEGIEVEEP
jgi:multicomponent Na+:H+ antiporter subunit G